MNKHILFVAHGMGDQKTGWHNDVANALQKAYENPIYTRREDTFLDRYEIVPINYFDVFERYRQDWEEGPDKILTMLANDDFFIADVSTADQPKVLSQIESAVEILKAGDNFFWTHVLDVLLYRYSLIVRSEVNVRVAEQILVKIDAMGVHHNWSIIAHSLGTSVLHNTLNALYTDNPVLGRPPLKPTTTRPSLIAMLANVGRVIQLGQARVYETQVKPGSLAKNLLCKHYVNARHKYDPFTWVKPFDPDPMDWLGEQGRKHYAHARPDTIHQINTHDFVHYVKDPETHVPLFRALESKYFITDAQKEKAEAEHYKGSAQDNNDGIRDALDAIPKNPAGGVKELIETMIAYYKLVKNS